MEPVFAECFSNDIFCPAHSRKMPSHLISAHIIAWREMAARGVGGRLCSAAMLGLPFITLSPATIEPTQKGYGLSTMTRDQFHSNKFEIK